MDSHPYCDFPASQRDHFAACRPGGQQSLSSGLPPSIIYAPLSAERQRCRSCFPDPYFLHHHPPANRPARLSATSVIFGFLFSGGRRDGISLYDTFTRGNVMLGALIGAERQWRQRMAGLRTNALVATGAAVFILSAMSASPDSPGAYCSADRLRYRLSWGRGDYARWYERPRPQYRRHAVVFGRDRRTLRPGTVLERDGGYAGLFCAPISCCARRAHSAFLPGAGDEEKRHGSYASPVCANMKNAVRQLLLEYCAAARFTLQDCSRRRRTPRTILEICAQLISHKQHQKTLAQIMAADGRSAGTSHRCTGVSEA